MITRTPSRPTKWTSLAIACAVVATAAYAGDRSSAPADPAIGAQKAPATAGSNRFIVTYRDARTRPGIQAQTQAFAMASRELGFAIAPVRTLATGSVLIRADHDLDREASKRLVNALMQDPNVLAVEPDYKLQPAMTPNDEYYPYQWALRNGKGAINAEPAWDLSTGTGVVVAVLDTGSTPHSDLKANLIPGYDFISADPDGSFFTAIDGNGRDPDANDPGDWHGWYQCADYAPRAPSSWHGTAVAGIVAAVTNNHIGLAGTAFDAKVEPVRVLGKCGGYVSDIVDAVVWASGGAVAGVPNNPQPAEVINLSLGGHAGSCSVAEQRAFDSAVGRGSTVVVAAGNDTDYIANHSPSSCHNVIVVTAVEPSGQLIRTANYGRGVSVAAAGGILTTPTEDYILRLSNYGARTQGTESYSWGGGTSLAAPFVAGIVALMQSAAPTPLSPARVKKILENTAYASGDIPTGCDSAKPCGAGIVDAGYAVAVAKGLKPLPADPPSLPPPPPPSGTPLQNGKTVTGIRVAQDGSVLYYLSVPTGAKNLKFVMHGGTGDADMYVRWHLPPTEGYGEYDCRSMGGDNEETCAFATPANGDWYVRVKGYTAAKGVSLTGSFTTPTAAASGNP